MDKSISVHEYVLVPGLGGGSGGSGGFYHPLHGNENTPLEASTLSFGDKVFSKDFIEGIIGFLLYINKENRSYMELDNLTVRGSMRIYELIVDKIRAIKGSQIISQGNGKIYSIEETATRYIITLEEEYTSFAAGDFVRCQKFDGKNVHAYWVQVESSENNTVTFLKSEFTDWNLPMVGDEIVQFGNEWDPERQSIIYIGATDGNPRITIYDNVDSKVLASKERVVIGSLDGIDDENGVTGYGLWCDNAYVKGQLKILPGSDGLHNFKEWNDLELSIELVNKLAEDSAAELKKTNDYIDATLDPKIEGLQNQIDGTIESYFYAYDPTLGNYPANTWNDDANNAHLGDTFTNTTSGRSWRWSKNEQGTEYLWIEITDTAAAKALAEAAKAQDTADGKRRVFVSTPFTPYDVGDLWSQGGNGDLMACVYARETGSYVSTDWDLASKYTDDTVAEQALEELRAFENYTNAILNDYRDQLDDKINSYFFDYNPTLENMPTVNWETDQVKEQHVGDTFTNSSTGVSWRWVVSNGVYEWDEITDTATVKALNDAAKAQDTADGKRRVFTDTPYTPYEVGDLWSQGAYGDIMACKYPRLTGDFVASDWDLASKYTDDEKALEAIEFYNNLQDFVYESLDGVSSQLDSVVSSHFFEYLPTLINPPASNWESNTLKDLHLGDTFTQTSSGRSWRFVYVDGAYKWQEISDMATVTALANAAKAQDTADGKRRVFTSTPYPPYEIGDLWSQGADGDLMACFTERLTGSFNTDDWGKASKYTDDTALENVVSPSNNILYNSFRPLPSSTGAEFDNGGYATTSNVVTYWNDLLRYAEYIPSNSEIVISIRCKARISGGPMSVYINGDNGYVPFDKDVTSEFQVLHCKRLLKYGVLSSNKIHINPGWVTAENPLVIHWITLRVGNVIVNVYEKSPYQTEEELVSANDRLNDTYSIAEANGEIDKSEARTLLQLESVADQFEADLARAEGDFETALRAEEEVRINQINTVNNELNYLKSQLDNEISNWFYDYEPTLSNYPANEWTTPELKEQHVGDTFTDTSKDQPTSGFSWRFVKDGESYIWLTIADSDLTKALLLASEAKAVADGKSTTYLTKPTSYKLGDSWILEAAMTINAIAYPKGEFLVSNADSDFFNQSDWSKEVRYTDDTAVENLKPASSNILYNSFLPTPSSVGSAIDQSGYPTTSNSITFWNDLLKYSSYIPSNSEIVISIRCKAVSLGGEIKVYLNSDNGYLAFDKNVTNTWNVLHCKRTLKWGLSSIHKLHISGDWISESDKLVVHWITLRVGNTVIDVWDKSTYELQEQLTNAQNDLSNYYTRAQADEVISQSELNNTLALEAEVTRLELELAQSSGDLQKAIDKNEEGFNLEIAKVNTSLTNLQDQLDSKVENWFREYDPTLNNLPAGDWSLIEKLHHVGDTFTNILTGKSWEFTYVFDYQWSLIENTATSKALADAGKAQSTADGKSTTFLLRPTEYRQGDMWILEEKMIVNAVSYPKGDLLISSYDSERFLEYHWSKEVNFVSREEAEDIISGNLLFDSYRPLSASSGAGINIGVPYVQNTASYFDNLLAYIDDKVNDGDTITITMRCRMDVGGVVSCYLNANNGYQQFDDNATTSWKTISLTRIVSGGLSSSNKLHLSGSMTSSNKLYIDWITLNKGRVAANSHTLSTADSVPNEINLLKNSAIGISNTNYLTASVGLVSDSVEHGDIVTIVIKGSLGDGKTDFAIFNSGSVTQLGAINKSKFVNGIGKVTIRWNTEFASNSSLWFYAYPSSVSSTSKIEWVKAVKGYITSDHWSASSNDTKFITEAFEEKEVSLIGGLALLSAVAAVNDDDEITAGICGVKEVAPFLFAQPSSQTTSGLQDSLFAVFDNGTGRWGIFNVLPDNVMVNGSNNRVVEFRSSDLGSLSEELSGLVSTASTNITSHSHRTLESERKILMSTVSFRNDYDSTSISVDGITTYAETSGDYYTSAKAAIKLYEVTADNVFNEVGTLQESVRYGAENLVTTNKTLNLAAGKVYCLGSELTFNSNSEGVTSGYLFASTTTVFTSNVIMQRSSQRNIIAPNGSFLMASATSYSYNRVNDNGELDVIIKGNVNINNKIY